MSEEVFNLLEDARSELAALIDGAKSHEPTKDLIARIEEFQQQLAEHEENILEEANRIVGIGRGRSLRYGHPAINFSHTADLWHAAFGWNADATKVAMAQVLLKVSRECNSHTRDNLTDIAGYARTLEMVHEYIEEQAAIREVKEREPLDMAQR